MSSDFDEISYTQLKNIKPGFYWFRNDVTRCWVIVEVYFNDHDVPRVRVCPFCSERKKTCIEFSGELGPQIIPSPYLKGVTP
jgi:hypothetical protein